MVKLGVPLIFHATQKDGMSYAQLSRGDWRFFDMQGSSPSRVGAGYASERELLADASRFLGCYFGDLVAAYLEQFE